MGGFCPVTVPKMDSACATMAAGSCVLAGSSMVLPSFAMELKADMYCSATRKPAAWDPP